MTQYYAIIPAAGIGARMHADCPKQYLKVHGEIILQRVINTFTRISCIAKVIVALHPEDHWWPMLNLLHPEKVLTVVGGKERVHSVLLSLQYLAETADAEDFVLVHDAARPGISEAQILSLIDAVEAHSVGGLLGLPIVDTIKKVDSADDIECTLSREKLWVAQTPQCFRFALLKSAIEKSLSDNDIVTDDASAIENAGYHPKMILGDRRNFKITFPEDIFFAEKVLD